MIRDKSSWPNAVLPFGAALISGILLSASDPIFAADLGVGEGSPAYRTLLAGPVDAMPDRMRRAYLRSIVDELASRGFLPGRGTPLTGRDIASAVRRYQAKVKLRVDGVASRELLDYMLFVDYGDGSGQSRIASALPDDPPVRLREAPAHQDRVARLPQASRPRDPGSEVSREPLPPLPAPVEPKTLPDTSLGSSATPDDAHTRRAPSKGAPMKQAESADGGGGGFVSRVQRALRSRGYYAGDIDGVFGRETSRAVRRFQNENGLPPTGAIDAPLLNALSIG